MADQRLNGLLINGVLMNRRCFSHLFIGQSIQELMVGTEEQIPQDGVPVTHHHILIQQGRLGNGVHQELEEKRDKQKTMIAM